jgi:hypothetical protein
VYIPWNYEEGRATQQNVSSHQQEEKCRGFIVCVIMASISETMNLTYNAGDDTLIGIKKNSRKLQRTCNGCSGAKRGKPPILILKF